MAKPGYQAVALDAPVARALRDVAHYQSVISGQRVTTSDALATLIRSWVYQQHLDPAAESFIIGHLDRRIEAKAAKAADQS